MLAHTIFLDTKTKFLVYDGYVLAISLASMAIKKANLKFTEN